MELSDYFGGIDLTKLGQIVRQHPELVKVANMKDGTQHKFLDIEVSHKQGGADQYGNAAYVKAYCKKADRRQGVNYFFGDLKLSQNSQQQGQQQAQQAVSAPQQPVINPSDDLPF